MIIGLIVLDLELNGRVLSLPFGARFTHLGELQQAFATGQGRLDHRNLPALCVFLEAQYACILNTPVHWTKTSIITHIRNLKSIARCWHSIVRDHAPGKL